MHNNIILEESYFVQCENSHCGTFVRFLGTKKLCNFCAFLTRYYKRIRQKMTRSNERVRIL